MLSLPQPCGWVVPVVADSELAYKRGSVHLVRGWVAIHLSDLPWDASDEACGPRSQV